MILTMKEGEELRTKNKRLNGIVEKYRVLLAEALLETKRGAAP